MNLKTWRQTQAKTMRECAEMLETSDARAYQRYESGEHWPSAPMIEQIVAMTGGEVTIADLHAQRLIWLRENRPSAFGSNIAKEAAE
jgi:transcriptional regulator with XRE-family HTH domain